jgi:hypothetical protein
MLNLHQKNVSSDEDKSGGWGVQNQEKPDDVIKTPPIRNL